MQKRKRRNKKKKTRNIIIVSIICLTFTLITAYSAFSTKLTLTAKGTIIDLNKEIDKKVPTNDLLLWVQANNKENTTNTLKDKSVNRNDIKLFGATYTEEGLSFDGIDDYGTIDLLNYEETKMLTIDFVLYVKNPDSKPVIFESSPDFNGNYGGYVVAVNPTSLQDSNDILGFGIKGNSNEIHNNSYNTKLSRNMVNDLTFKHYTIVVDTTKTYDNFTSIFLNGTKQETFYNREPADISDLSLKNYPFYVATRGGTSFFSSMVLKELMIYKRTLSNEEIQTLQKGFEQKYKITTN